MPSHIHALMHHWNYYWKCLKNLKLIQLYIKMWMHEFLNAGNPDPYLIIYCIRCQLIAGSHFYCNVKTTHPNTPLSFLLENKGFKGIPCDLVWNLNGRPWDVVSHKQGFVPINQSTVKFFQQKHQNENMLDGSGNVLYSFLTLIIFHPCT